MDNALIANMIDSLYSTHFDRAVNGAYRIATSGTTDLDIRFLSFMRLLMVVLEMEIVFLNASGMAQTRYAHTGQQALRIAARVAHNANEYVAAATTEQVITDLRHYMPLQHTLLPSEPQLMAPIVTSLVLSKCHGQTVDTFNEHMQYASGQLLHSGRAAHVANINAGRTDVLASLNLFSEIGKQTRDDRSTIHHDALHMIVTTVRLLATTNVVPSPELVGVLYTANPMAVSVVQRSAMARLGYMPRMANNTPRYTDAVCALGHSYMQTVHARHPM